MQKAKELFQTIRDLNKKVAVKTERLERLKALSTKVTSTMSEANTKPSGVSRTLEDTMAAKVDLENELIGEIVELISANITAQEILRQMENEKYRRSLEVRYCNGGTIEDVADNLECSTKWAGKTIKKALAEAEKIMEKIK